MALKTGDYIEMGNRAARGEMPAPANLREGSWQHAAYRAGFDAAKKADAVHTPLEVRAEAEQAHWPAPVREHVRVLALRFATDCDNPRAPRWGRSINRMYQRYGRGPQGAQA